MTDSHVANLSNSFCSSSPWIRRRKAEGRRNLVPWEPSDIEWLMEGDHLISTHLSKVTLVMGKLTISTGPFSIAMLSYQRVNCYMILLYTPMDIVLNRNLMCNYGDQLVTFPGLVELLRYLNSSQVGRRKSNNSNHPTKQKQIKGERWRQSGEFYMYFQGWKSCKYQEFFGMMIPIESTSLSPSLSLSLFIPSQYSTFRFHQTWQWKIHYF